MTNANITVCPICDHSEFQKGIEVLDYSISQQNFGLIHCNNCLFTITSPRPHDENLAQYYQSENYISHSGTKKGIINKLYFQFQKLNLRLKYNAIAKYVPRGTWMDFGAGNGAFLNFLKLQMISAEGFEPEMEARKIGTKNGAAIQDSIHYKQDSREYAAITMWHVLEHIPNLNEIISKHYSNLMQSGLLIIAIPNHHSYDSNYYKDYWAALDVPRHLWHFSEQNIIDLIERSGFDHVSTKPMIMDSYYVSMLSEKYKKGFLLRGVIIGLVSNIFARFSRYPFSSQIYVFRKKTISTA